MIFKTYLPFAKVIDFVQTKLVPTIHTCCVISLCKSYEIERVINFQQKKIEKRNCITEFSRLTQITEFTILAFANLYLTTTCVF